MGTEDIDAPAPATDRESSIVIRMWRELDHHSPFRGRLIHTGAGGETDVVLTADPAEVRKQVEDWIADFTECVE